MPTTDPITEFRQNLAVQLAKAARNEGITQSYAGNIAAKLGLTLVSWDAADDRTFTVPAVEVSKTINGIPRADLTAEALARYEARELHAVRSAAYSRLGTAARNGYLAQDTAIGICSALGLPVPAAKTHVTYSIEGFGSGSFTLDGDVPENEVQEKMLPLAVNPESDAIRELFGNVAGLQSRAAVYTETSTSWPPFPLFTEDNGTSTS